MTRQIVFLPDAEADIRDASLSGISRNPVAYPIVHDALVRRALTRKFPYALFYFLESDAIIIIAVFNVKRDPKVWRGRV